MARQYYSGGANILCMLAFFLIAIHNNMATNECTEKNTLSSAVTRLNSGHNIPMVGGFHLNSLYLTASSNS